MAGGFFMELNTHICRQLIEKANAFAQITLDDDYIVRDNKPDVLRIIYSKGDILLEDIKAGNQAVWITGKLRFDTLYQSDDENHRLESISGEIPFQEKIIMDELEDEEVSVNVRLEDLSIGIINSRKLTIRAVLNIWADSRMEAEYAIASRVLEEEKYEQKISQLPVMCLLCNEKDVLRIQKEILLPNSRGNIGEIIFHQVNFRNEEILLQGDKVQIQMDVQVWILYRSESNGEYECFETVVPVAGEIECENTRGDEVFWSKIVPTEIEIEPRADYDGESRMIGVDMAFSVEIQIYREEMCERLVDVYSLDKEVTAIREELALNQLLMKNSSKIRLVEQVQLEKNQERILQICGCNGKIIIDRVQKREKGIQVEGIMSVHIIYNTLDDAMPYAHSNSQIAFDQFVEIEGFTEDSHYLIDDKIEQLQVNLLDNSEYEIKATIQIAVLAMGCEQIANIVAIEEEPIDMEALQKQPGMIGCIKRKDEDIWDIAKRYHATAENIIEMEDKVLVIKQVR